MISLAEKCNLELQYRKSFTEIWQEEKNSAVFGPLSERMGVRGRDAGPLLVTDEEMEAASMFVAMMPNSFSADCLQASTMHSVSIRSRNFEDIDVNINVRGVLSPGIHKGVQPDPQSSC